MTDIDKAREWASGIEHLAKVIHPDAQAAIEIIQSLPDQWVDVEKVREVINGQLSVYTRGTASHYIAEEITRKLKEALLTPKLPTLADMTREEQEACQWMQCEIDGQIAGILARVDEQRGHIWIDSGYSLGWKLENITPVPDLPKLQWPGGVVDAEIVEEPEPVDAPPAEKAALQKPEDVPANEPWLIEVDGQKAIGTRHKGSTIVPWSVAALDGSFAGDFHDNEVTLIHKLVPESPALPEGMRLADHEEYGRVVVSPKVDTDGDYKVFHLNGRFGGGAVFHFVRPDDLTFLDGDQHV